MHGHDVRPGLAFAGQKLKFTGHLSDDRLLVAGLQRIVGETWQNCGGVTCDGLASRPGEVEILPAASCDRNRDKLRQLWARRGSKASLFLCSSSVGAALAFSNDRHHSIATLDKVNFTLDVYILIRYFATGSADALVSLWDLDELVCVRTFSRLEWVTLKRDKKC